MTNIPLQWYLWYLTTAHIVMLLCMPIYYVCIYFFLHNIVLWVRNKCIYIFVISYGRLINPSSWHRYTDVMSYGWLINLSLWDNNNIPMSHRWISSSLLWTSVWDSTGFFVIRVSWIRSPPYEIMVVAMSYGWVSKPSVWEDICFHVQRMIYEITTDLILCEWDKKSSPWDKARNKYHTDELIIRLYAIVLISSHTDELLCHLYTIVRGWKTICNDPFKPYETKCPSSV